MMGNIFTKGQFQIDPNMSPEQIATRRALMAALRPRFGSAKYVGEGLGQLATGIVMGKQDRKLDQIESAGRESADSLFSGLLGRNNVSASTAGTVAPMSILGVMPEYDQNSPEGIANDTMAALGKPLNPETVKAGLVARGLPEHVAEGFVMNFEDESGLDPGINETSPLVPGSRGGFGLAQWTGPRRVALEEYASSVGKPPSDPNVQMDFLMMELQGPEAAAWSKISSAQDAGSAGVAIVESFLRPAEEHRTARAAKYAGSGPAANAATPAIPTDQLLAALGSSWFSPEQRQVLMQIYDQQVQAGDPVNQMAAEKARLELDALKNPAPAAPPEDFTERMFILNAMGIDPQSEEGRSILLTGELPSDPASNAPAAFASLDMQAQAAGYEPGTPEYQEFMRNGGGSGTPAAFTALDMQAQAAGFTPGTPEYQEFMATRGAGFAAAAVEKGKATAEAEIAAPGDISTAETTLTYIDSIRNHPGRAIGSGGSSFLGAIPGTGAREFQIEVERLKSGAFMTAIEQLRGMGALSNAEGQTATAAVAALDPSGSEDGFLKRLAEYEAIVNRGLERAKKRIAAPTGAAPETGTTPSGATVIDGYTIEAIE